MNPKVIDAITAEISELFSLPQDDLFNLKVDYGLSYLKHRFAEDQELQEALAKHPQFWLWWRGIWAQRDYELLQRCELKQYGINYTYLLNGYVGTQRMQETHRVFAPDMWDFYGDFHYWHKVKFYPNEVLINECLVHTAA